MTDAIKPPLGRLKRVELREAWLGEQTDFTPWLAQSENITLLGEAIGVELEVESQETNVGPFRADILCRDTLGGHYVLIENQLERTDHIHLGQLLTYAAGLEAVTIVWVAARFTDEHRAALDWLNSATREGFNFFGLEIELWRIGDSPFAPKFNVVSKPNDWSKAVREQAAAAQSTELTEAQRIYLDFWTQFREFLEARKSPVRTNRPSKDQWTTLSIGRTNFGLTAWNVLRDNRSGVHLGLWGPDAKAHYRLIEQRYREQVEQQLAPFGTVTWRLMPDQKESQIAIYHASTPAKAETWPELNEWMASTLEAMNALFRPIVKSLNAAEFQAPTDGGPNIPPAPSLPPPMSQWSH